MLKLTIFLLAALAAPCIVRAQIVATLFQGFSNLITLNGFQVCHPTSPFWADTFLSQNIAIESIFKDANARAAAPTIQTAFKIRFTCPKYFPFHSESYVASDPQFAFSKSFVGWDGRPQPYPSWINFANTGSIITITDFCTNSVVVAIRNPFPSGPFYYDIFLYTDISTVQSASGLLAKGCPRAYTQLPLLPGYSANQNVGRRKRQTDQCKEIASIYAKEFPDVVTFSSDNIYNLCINSAQLARDDARVPVYDTLKSNLDALREGYQIYKDNFGDATAAVKQ